MAAARATWLQGSVKGRPVSDGDHLPQQEGHEQRQQHAGHEATDAPGDAFLGHHGAELPVRKAHRLHDGELAAAQDKAVGHRVEHVGHGDERQNHGEQQAEHVHHRGDHLVGIALLDVVVKGVERQPVGTLVVEVRAASRRQLLGERAVVAIGRVEIAIKMSD